MAIRNTRIIARTTRYFLLNFHFGLMHSSMGDCLHRLFGVPVLGKFKVILRLFSNYFHNFVLGATNCLLLNSSLRWSDTLINGCTARLWDNLTTSVETFDAIRVPSYLATMTSLGKETLLNLICFDSISCILLLIVPAQLENQFGICLL